MQRRGWKSTAAYAALLAAAFVVGVAVTVIGNFGDELDNSAYDFMLRRYQPTPWQTESAILAIDEHTLVATPGGMQGIRGPLAEALRLVSAAGPKTVAIDLTLADSSKDPKVDQNLADAMRTTPNLVLATDLLNDAWEEPLPEFAKFEAALGHVHAAPDNNDEITRAVSLEKTFGYKKKWALSLEAFRLYSGASEPVQSPEDLQVGGTLIPVPDRRIQTLRGDEQGDGRFLRVRFVPPNMQPIPRVSMEALLRDHSLARAFTGKAVFVGVTAVTEVKDRLMTPVGSHRTTGIEINAEAFETMARGLFITDVSGLWVGLFSLGLMVAMGLSFRYLPGWLAYGGAAILLAAACVTPYVFFTHQRVFSFATPAAVAWLSFLAAAGYYHLVVRRDWRTEQAARARYQQAMHFVTHEMRTPLSAIQGSSELISRFALTEEKRKQIAQLINSESKRLARMVEIFLNVERLSAGQMELKRETIPVREMVALCLERVQPLAERKRIAVAVEPMLDNMQVTGDRELMEYACYNLLTNAVKYSPQRTEVRVSAWKESGHVRIAVKDQGIGMDQKEVKQIFQKFYRTRKAEESGEAGTGIGLSIVQQIVEQHGGEIDVVSQPGAGSCFTLVLPAAVATPNPVVAERR
ncbi:MAG: CHASE2 domain-containing protein [Bryobacteraceae bacterium]|jgi:signal transduction histidine kinase